MNILIDLTYINPKNTSGVANYSKRLLKGFNEINCDENIYLLVTENNKDFISNYFSDFPKIIINTKNGYFYNKLFFLRTFFNKQIFNQILIENNINLVISPYLTMNTLISDKYKQIGVLHDTQEYNQFKEKGIKGKGIKGKVYRFLIRYVINKIDHIITISNFAKESILNDFPYLENKTSVIYNSVDYDSNILIKKDTNIIKPYILYVNTLMPYKNLETLVKAYNLIKEKISHNVIVKGKKTPYWNNVIVPLIEEYNLSNEFILIDENYDDTQMKSLFKNADLFVTTSKNEGFGYTPIEAAILKVPVISSKETALYETTQGILNYYEPVEDYQNLSIKILELLNNKPINLEEISKRFIDDYSPKKQAENFLKIIKNIGQSK